jgi:hypothetical protein
MITAEQLMALRNDPAKMEELANSPIDPHAIMAGGGLSSIGLPEPNLGGGGMPAVTPPGPMPGLGGAPAPAVGGGNEIWGALSALQGLGPKEAPTLHTPVGRAAARAPIPQYLPHVGAPQTQDLSTILAGFKK